MEVMKMFIDIARKRHSVRSYENKPVEKEKILQVLEAARLSPSACNLQPRYFIVITDERLKSKVAGTFPGAWLKKAPAIIAVCGDHSGSWKRADGKDHCDIDAAIATDHMTLAATEMGLGTCWVCAFDAKRCHEILQLPENLEATVLLAVGYPADGDKEHAKDRKSLDEIAGWNGYGAL